MLLSPLPGDELPLTYQKEDVKYIYNTLTAGESCSLIGIGSGGKSNLFQHLTHDKVKKRYLRDLAPYFITVFIDPVGPKNLTDAPILAYAASR